MQRKKDQAEKETDNLLEELEKKIVREYKQALKEVKQKYNDFAKVFEDEDEIKKKKLKDGLITQEQYDNWRTEKLYSSKRFQKLADVLAEDLTKKDQKVMSITNGYLPEAYALNFNYSTYEIEQGAEINTSFTLYSRETVERLLENKEIQLPKRKVDIPKDQSWNKKHINSAILQGVLQGDSIPNIADRLQQVTDMDRRAAIRNARTMMTGAQNSGRIDAYDRASNLGINIQKEWLATLDGRTRDSHAALDGERVDYKKAFSNGLMYPGDPNGDPSEVYNCRCTMVPYYPEYEDITEKRVTYKEWTEAKEEPKQKIINGKDISLTWERRPKLFDFEIEDVINAQGFDGLPRVVSPEEFDEYVKQANDGNGFIAQRIYSAPNQETLDAYRDQLYNGKWYIDCSEGGSTYGRGMYSAADYSGHLSDGIIDAMKKYENMNEDKGNKLSYIETFTLDKTAKIADYDEIEDKVIKLAQEKGAKFIWGREDIGVYAAKLGYDAISVPLVGNKNYTIILNRTKVIFKENK